MCSSLGHSVPRIGGRLQGHGKTYQGAITAFDRGGDRTRMEMEFARAYRVPGLKSLRRTIQLDRKERTVELKDEFGFSGRRQAVEEAFVTWRSVKTRGRSARIDGDDGTLRLRIVEPAGARFEVQRVAVTKKSGEEGTLRRIVCRLPRSAGAFHVTISG
jgi:hypothetical protein